MCLFVLCPRDDSQGALRFAPVRPSVCPSVLSSCFTVQSLCNQLIPQFLMAVFETLQTCCGHTENVHVGFLVELELILTDLQPFEPSHCTARQCCLIRQNLSCAL